MNQPHLRGSARRILFASGLAALVGLVLVACGGGGSDTEAAVQATERAHAMGLIDKLPVSWAPKQIAFSLNPGARQDVPITLTTTKALSNARIVFVPDLRDAVTVTPAAIAALAAGQSATVNLTFAPASTDTRKLIAGFVLLYDRNATTSQPLPVTVSLVKPESINGIAVPPEPPADLNNATLAGFDSNGNGVRDDVERLIAKNATAQTEFTTIMKMAGAVQQILLITSPAKTQLDPLWKSIACSSGVGDVDYYKTILTATLNTAARKSNYSGRMSGYGGAFVVLNDCNK